MTHPRRADSRDTVAPTVADIERHQGARIGARKGARRRGEGAGMGGTSPRRRPAAPLGRRTGRFASPGSGRARPHGRWHREPGLQAFPNRGYVYERPFRRTVGASRVTGSSVWLERLHRRAHSGPRSVVAGSNPAPSHGATGGALRVLGLEGRVGRGCRPPSDNGSFARVIIPARWACGLRSLLWSLREPLADSRARLGRGGRRRVAGGRRGSLAELVVRDLSPRRGRLIRDCRSSPDRRV